MPVNESSRKSRPRKRDGLGLWDFSPEQIREQEKGNTMTPQANQLAVNAQRAQAAAEKLSKPQVIDINNPPREPYIHQEFPRAMYHHRTGHVITVQDEKEMAARKRYGFKLEPSPNHDYSQVTHGIAAKKVVDEMPELELEEDFEEESDGTQGEGEGAAQTSHDPLLSSLDQGDAGEAPASEARPQSRGRRSAH